MRKIYILTPSYDGKTVCDFTVCMAEIFRIAAQTRSDLQMFLRFWMGEALIQKARNNLFSDAYLADADDIVFIDADQSFKPQAFFDLIDQPVDAVGIPVPMKVDEERYNIRPEAPAKHQWKADLKLLQVECIGTGMLRLSRKAMDVLWLQSTRYNDGNERRLICDVQIINGGMISEDIQICEKLKKAGIPIYADIKHTCDHFGVKRFKGNYRDHYANAVVSAIKEA